ncbi:MAG: hypothetical protein L0170_07750 [Acidobacteria bacterium]|nr:hypothetical protein [Acidobacteriota bacterium]
MKPAPPPLALLAAFGGREPAISPWMPGPARLRKGTFLDGLMDEIFEVHAEAQRCFEHWVEENEVMA